MYLMTECALFVGKANSCFSEKAQMAIKKSLGVENMQEAKDKLGVDLEFQVLHHPKVKILIDVKDERRRFKTVGPHATVPLSNYEIDLTLDQWELQWPDFLNFHITMLDFEKYGAAMAVVDYGKLFRGEVKEIPLPLFHKTKEVGRPIKYCATVLNSDYSTGGGKHWVAVFIDLTADPVTLELFNSSGNPIYPEFLAWGEKMRIDMQKMLGKKALTVQVSNVRHQFSDSECGPYSLYYIFSRLSGVSYDNFKHNPVPDATVTAFRKKIFLDEALVGKSEYVD